jgi:predicted pyridoxine 5'-phosphate oxidase superfamily flavin-nucleotide-binding protein
LRFGRNRADLRCRVGFAVDSQLPRSVIVITIDAVYFQCARAIVRSNLWSIEAQVDPATIPTPGQILAQLSDNRVGGDVYDKEWPVRAAKSMW